MTDYLGFGFAALVAAGGIYGYVHSGSTPSLVAGIIFGGILGAGAYQMTTTGSPYISLGASALLAGMMAYRYLKTEKFMPPGMVAVLSLGMTIRYVVIAVQVSKHRTL